jgi:nucleotide-binding universal stress UspA family protein
MFARVLVPLDGSALSETALPWVRGLAAALGTEVYLLRVIPEGVQLAGMGFDGFGPPPAPLSTPEEWAAWERDARCYLRRVAEAALPEIKPHIVVRRGEAAPEIVRAAREHGVEAVVMSTHGRTGLGRLVLGSVAEAVVHRVGLPVVLLRPDEAALAAAPSAAHPARRPMGG